MPFPSWSRPDAGMRSPSVGDVNLWRAFVEQIVDGRDQSSGWRHLGLGLRKRTNPTQGLARWGTRAEPGTGRVPSDCRPAGAVWRRSSTFPTPVVRLGLDHQSTRLVRGIGETRLHPARPRASRADHARLSRQAFPRTAHHTSPQADTSRMGSAGSIITPSILTPDGWQHRVGMSASGKLSPICRPTPESDR